MSTTAISTADLDRLEPTLTALLSPLDHRSPREWSHAVMTAARPLFGADQALMVLPEDSVSREPARMSGEGPFIEEAVRAYERYFWRVDLRRRLALEREIFHADMIFDRSDYDRLEILVDWCIPYRLLDSIGMSVNDDGGFWALCFYHDSRDVLPFGETGLALLRLLRPAFKAGVHTWLRLALHRATVARLIDDLSVGLALFDTAGHLVHQNRTLSDLLSEDPEALRLRAEVERVGTAVAAASRSNRMRLPETTTSLVGRDVRTARRTYRLRGTYTPANFAGTGAAALVVVERVPPEPLSDLALRSGYRLTPREVQVARLLGQGKTNAEIAETLSISLHTAERHTEHVLMKLGVRSRAKVGAKIRGE